MELAEFGGEVWIPEVITSWLTKIDFSKRQSKLPVSSPGNRGILPADAFTVI